MVQRLKLIIAVLLFPISLVLAALWANFLSFLSIEHYMGMTAGAYLGIYGCVYLMKTWNPDTLQSTQMERPSGVFNDRALWVNTAVVFLVLTVVSLTFGFNYPRVYGAFGLTIVVLLFGYVGIRLATR